MNRPGRRAAGPRASSERRRSGPSPAEALRDDVQTLKRERILDTAAQLFHDRGYLQTTVDAIAERLGATKPFVYYHFRSKDDLLVAICERPTREALDALDAAVRARGTPLERFTVFMRAFARIALEDHRSVAIYFREQLNLPAQARDRIHAMRAAIHRKLKALLAQGAASGDFEVPEPGISALVVAGMSSYAFAWYREGGRLEPDEAAERIVRMALKLVGTR